MSWPLTRLDRVAQSWPSSVDKHSRDGELPVRLCNYTDVYKNDAITADVDFMAATATADEIERFRVRRGDTVITKDSETADDIGIPAFVDYEAPDLVCGYHLSIVRPDPKAADPRFVYWALASRFVKDQWSVLASGVTRVGLRRSDVARVAIPCPSLPEQRAIADYLDRETAQIDTLIAKQGELISGLRERRQSSIVSAFTAPGSSSNGTWPPRSPDHWSPGQVKNFGTVTLGKMLQSSPSTTGTVQAPYLRAANVQPDGVLAAADVKTMWFSPSELEQLSIQSGDVVVVEGGIGGYGRAAYVVEGLPGHGFQNSINRVRPFDGNDGRFLAYLLLAARAAGFIAAYCSVVSMPHLTAEKLAAMPILLPPSSEQREIADALDAQTAGIDLLIDKAERLVTLAQERRAALITAAVTGQLDIRTAA